MKKTPFFLAAMCGLLFSCKHEPQLLENIVSKDSLSISYDIDTIAIYQGDTGFINPPVIDYGEEPSSYFVYSNPETFNEEFTIKSSGGLSIDSTLDIGNYKLSIIASNSKGNYSFKDKIVVSVLDAPIAPSSLNYNVDTLFLEPNESGSATVSSVLGATPISYTMQLIPFYGTISINQNTGKISTTGVFTEGTYNASVTASNSYGTNVFSNVLVIKVEDGFVPPPLISFANDILPIISSRCGGCHTGGTQTNYTNYSNSSSNINSIINRINRSEGASGFMPKNGTKLSQQQLDLFQQWLDDGLQP